MNLCFIAVAPNSVKKSMASYEQTLRLFERWCADELRIFTVDKVTEPVIRRYINDLQERGKYTFYVNDQSKKKNYPERRRDYRKPISVATINNYIRKRGRKLLMVALSLRILTMEFRK